MYKSISQVIANTILENTRDGIVVTDNKNQIIFVNPAFIEITGYSFKEVEGKNPSLYRSKHHDDQFYSDMWANLLLIDIWEGEIFNQKKNGEVYLEYLTISVVRNSEEQITHYVAVYTDIDRLQKSERKLKRITHYDSLTDLANRHNITQHLTNQLEISRKNHKLLAILVLDLDDFKSINDHYGHLLGDQLLMVIAKRLQKICRSSDMVGRLGGDTFSLILRDINNMSEVEEMADRITKLIATLINIDGQSYHITTSMGLTVFPFDGANSEGLLRHADQAMYKAKEHGKNQYHLFDLEKDKQIQTRRELLSRLVLALSRNELILFYQPKVNLRTGKIIGAEALLRWQHPADGLLLPGTFLPHVEHHDVIVDIGEYVMRNALLQLRKWSASGIEISISINIAARQLLRRDFVDKLQLILNEYPDVDRGKLELEILESAALENTKHVKSVIEECRQLGIRFALDDFGTGYASLSYLRDLPADHLKIDRSFVKNVLTNEKDLTLIEGIIGLATAFQRKVIAEGVETIEQSILLMRLGCDIAQGFGIAKPMPSAEIPGWINQYKPDPKQAIWADTNWEMSDFPLLVAQFDHINWVKRILSYLDGKKTGMSKAEIYDHRACRFGYWYYHYAPQRYAHLKEYEDIEPVHIAVHEIGREITLLYDQGHQKRALSKVSELLRLKDTILEMLAALQLKVAKVTTRSIENS